MDEKCPATGRAAAAGGPVAASAGAAVGGDGVSETVAWMYDDPTSGFHDISCTCSGHCLNCREPLTGRQRRYCSESCGRQYRAGLAFDRAVESR